LRPRWRSPVIFGSGSAKPGRSFLKSSKRRPAGGAMPPDSVSPRMRSTGWQPPSLQISAASPAPSPRRRHSVPD